MHLQPLPLSLVRKLVMAQVQAPARRYLLVRTPMHKLAHLLVHSLTLVCSLTRSLYVQLPIPVIPLDVVKASDLTLPLLPELLPMLALLLMVLVRLPL